MFFCWNIKIISLEIVGKFLSTLIGIFIKSFSFVGRFSSAFCGDVCEEKGWVLDFFEIIAVDSSETLLEDSVTEVNELLPPF